MASLQTVTLKDRTTPTPVSHVYEPRQIDDNVGRLIQKGPQGTATGQSQLTVSGRQKNGSQRFLSELKLAKAKTIIETINGVQVPRVIGVSYATVIFDIDPNFTDADCQNLEGEVASALGADQSFLASVLIGRNNVHG